jgi:hypothetical protein
MPSMLTPCCPCYRKLLALPDANIYTIGWICAIKPQYVAAHSFLDEKHDRPERERVLARIPRTATSLFLVILVEDLHTKAMGDPSVNHVGVVCRIDQLMHCRGYHTLFVPAAESGSYLLLSLLRATFVPGCIYCQRDRLCCVIG